MPVTQRSYDDPFHEIGFTKTALDTVRHRKCHFSVKQASDATRYERSRGVVRDTRNARAIDQLKVVLMLESETREQPAKNEPCL